MPGSRDVRMVPRAVFTTIDNYINHQIDIFYTENPQNGVGKLGLIID